VAGSTTTRKQPVTFILRATQTGAFALTIAVILVLGILWIAVLVVVLLQLSAVYLSPLAAALGTVKPSLTDWIVIGSSGLSTIAIVEVTKLAFARHDTGTLTQAGLRKTSH